MKEARIQVADARKNFADVLARAAKKGERIKVVRYRTTLAGIVPGRDLERLDECEDLMNAGKGKRRSAGAKAAKKARKRPTSKATAKGSSRGTRATSRSTEKRATKAAPARK